MYTKVVTALPGGKLIHSCTKDKNTTQRINELRKQLGLDVKEETVKFNIKMDFRKLANKHLN